jgi:hypothetical protein
MGLVAPLLLAPVAIPSPTLPSLAPCRRWNCFGKHIDEKLIRETADRLVELGLAEAG